MSLGKCLNIFCFISCQFKMYTAKNHFLSCRKYLKNYKKYNKFKRRKKIHKNDCPEITQSLKIALTK